MNDGGYNCRSNRSGAVHSSLHSTLSVLEGITEYLLSGYKYRSGELERVKNSSVQFILQHQLFLSDRTGLVINKDFLKFPFPCRWRYDILRALDYFRYGNVKCDIRMVPAVDMVIAKRNKHETWNLNAMYPGKIHFEMEKAGRPSRWNTLRALRVLKHYKMN